MLTAIFPTRTMSYAQAMMKAVRDGSIFNIYDAVYGDSEGYAERKRDILMSGLTGTMETTASKFEELKRRIGESLADDVTTGANALGGMLNAINNMNPVLFDALVGGLESIAVMGPLLAVGGHAINGVLSLMAAHPLGAALLFTAFGVRAFSEAMETLAAIRFEEFKNQFGEMDLDSDAIMQYVTAQTEAFTNAYSAVDMWEKKLSEASESYLTNSGELAGRLTTMYITQQEVTPEDAETLKGLGAQMGQALVDGINASFNAAAAFDLALLGEDGVADPKILAFMQSMQALRDSMITNASTLGEELGAAMDTALKDGLVTGEEMAVIKEKMDAYNNAMSAIRDIENEAMFNANARRVQGVSWDSFSAVSDQINAEYDAAIAEARNNYFTEVGRQEAWLKYMVDNGQVNPATGQAWTDIEASAALAAFDEAEQKRIRDLESSKIETNMRMLDTIFSQIGVADAWDFIKTQYAGGATYNNGLLTGVRYGDYTDEQLLAIAEQYANFENKGINEYLEKAFGNTDTGRTLMALFGIGSEGIQNWMSGARGDQGTTEYSGMDLASLENRMMELDAEIQRVGIENASDLIAEWEAVNAAMDEAEGAEISFKELPPDQLPDWYNEYQAMLTGNPLSLPVVPKITGFLGGNVFGRGGGNAFAPNGGAPLFTIQDLYAEGGRATSASIFGEAGAEWAIPEEHSKRTAELLDAARKASGFGWGELVAMSNGAGGGGRGQMVYSPTIYANDGRGVREALMEDKARMDKWWREMQRRDALEVYA